MEHPAGSQRRLPPWLTALLVVGAALVVVAPTMRFPDRWADPYDWRYFESAEEVFRRTVAVYHEAPLWNPYFCGGEVALANPQSTWTAPTFLFSLLFGTPLGLKLALFVYFLAAIDGMRRLARDHGVSDAGALLAGLAFGTSGWFAMHLSSGHINFAGAALYPYLLLCYRRSIRESIAWTIPGGALLAWMAMLGGTYTLPMAGVMLGACAVTDAIDGRRTRPVGVVAAIGVVALLVGAVRLLPTLEFALAHPRPVVERDGLTLFDFLAAFGAWRNKLEPYRAGHPYWWHEYCCHLPYIALALAVYAAFSSTAKRAKWSWVPLALFALWSIAALLLPKQDHHLARYYGYHDAYWWLGAVGVWLAVRDGQARSLAPLLLVALGLATGRAWPYGPWFLLRHLPLYRNLRVPSRYLILAAIPLCVWAGMGLDRLRRTRFCRRGMVALAVALVGIEGLAFTAPTFADVFVTQYELPKHAPPFFQDAGDRRWMFPAVGENRGTLDCDEEAPLQRAESLRRGLGAQLTLDDPAAGNVVEESWSPDAIAFTAATRRPATVRLNENWNEHWKIASGDGASITTVAGELAVRVPAGTTRVVVRYRPTSFVVGAAISLACVPLFALAFLLGLRRRRPPV